MNGQNMKQIIEALLIATDEPLSEARIIELTGLSHDEIKRHIDDLNNDYRLAERSFEIKEIAGGYQIYTLPVFAEWVSALLERKSKLSKAALETIAIIAYHQPITRPEIEKLRGVDSSWVIDTLLEKGLVKTSGREPVPGRPIKYATTKEFLRYFGIKDLTDLPREEDFSEQITSIVDTQDNGLGTNTEEKGDEQPHPEPAEPPEIQEPEEDLEENDFLN